MAEAAAAAVVPKVRVTYWSFKNRGNWGRLICEVSGMKYEDQTDPEIIKSTVAASSDLSNKPTVMAVPMLEVWDSADADTASVPADLQIGQSAAVARYLASISPRKGMMPDSVRDQFKADVIFQNVNDYIVDAVPWKWEKTGSASLPEFLIGEKGRVSRWLTVFENELSDDKPFFFGDEVSYADLGLYNVIVAYIEAYDYFQAGLYQSHVLDRFPRVNAMYQAVCKIDEVIAFAEKQSSLKSWPLPFGEAFVVPFKADMEAAIKKMGTAAAVSAE